MRPVSVAVLWLLVVAVVALFALAPATWVDRRVAASTGGNVRINDAQGTVWRGHGALGDSRGTWRVPIAWRIAPLSLTRGAVDIEFDAASGSDGPTGRITLENGGAHFHNFRLRTPAAVLQTFAPSQLRVIAGGEWILDAPEFRYAVGRTEGAIDLRWEHARIASAGSVLDLETLTGHLASQGGALTGTFANAGSDARIDGDVAISANGATVRANIATGPGVPPDIARMIAALGTPDANGVVHVQWQIASR
ncbi:MAG TPA: type II secretion system protein N [Casimicrobiaceae bacterium]|jgi:hypothetical protein